MSVNNALLTKNYLSGAAISAYRIVKLGSDDSHVIQAAAATDGLIGAILELPATAAEQSVDVIVAGIAEIELGGSVTRGALLTSNNVGQAVTASEDNRVIGVALFSGDSGDIVPVLINASGQITDSATFVAAGTIPAASVKTLNATPYELIAAPGAGKAIVLVGATFFMDYGSAGYDAVGATDDLQIRYTNGSGTLLATVETIGFLNQTTDQTRYVYPITTAAVVPTANAALVAYIATSEIFTAAGDSPIKFKVEYRVIDTTW